MLLSRTRIRTRSRGFTLVELMVSAALAVTIMWILAESFKMGIDFARSARSTGDMMSQLNNAGQIMMRDLGQTGTFSASGQPQHFLPPPPPLPQITGAMRNIGQVQMPDNLNALAANVQAATGYGPPNGYFHLYSPPPTLSQPWPFPNPSWTSSPDDSEGFYIDTINPLTVPANGASSGHQLQFTAFLPQGLPQNQFVATCPPPGSQSPSQPQTYYSRAAEIAYFLGPQIGQTEPQLVTAGMTNQPLNGGAPLPLFNLYRRQRLVAVTTDYQLSLAIPFNSAVPATYDPAAADVISATLTAPGQYSVNTLASFSAPYLNNTTAPIPATRVPVIPLGSPRIGDDIVLSNVLSFEVLATWDPSPTVLQPPTARHLAPQPIPWMRPYLNPVTNGILNSNYPYDYLPPPPQGGVNTVQPYTININRALPYTFDTWYSLTLPPLVAKNGRTIPNPNNWNNFTRAPNNPNLIPMPARINGIQITVRIYDPKTHQARQNTWRVAL